MKITVRQLKRLITETLDEESGVVFGTRDELDRSISAMDPDTIADKDYVDQDTGEVYLELGKPAVSSVFHPAYVKKPKKLHRGAYTPEEDLIKAIADFAENWTDFGLESPDIEPEAGAADSPESFFAMHPEWARGADDLGISLEELKAMIVDAVYAAMTKHD